MLELAGPLAVAALVLAAGGTFKLRDPEPTVAMFGALGWLRARPALVMAYASGALELAVGMATFLVGGRVLATSTAILFAGFAAVAGRLVRLPSGTSCGCFGRHSGQTTWIHVVVDLALAAAASVAAVADAPGFLDARSSLPVGGALFVALAALGAWFAVAALTVLPEAMARAKRGPQAGSVKAFDLTSWP
jgi:hypothetical protein